MTIRVGGGGGSGTSGQGLPSTIVSKTANYTAAAGEFVQANAAAGGFTVTLPSAPATGALVTVKKVDGTASVVTVTPAGAGTIDGDPNATITSPQFGAVFEHVGSDAWKITAPTSAGGSNGVDGKSVRSGSGAPSSGLGVDGDFYIDTTAKALYGPKTAGAWGSSTSLIGPSGSNGSNGAIAQIQDEGSNLPVRPTLNFIGGNVTAADNAGQNRTDVTVSVTGNVILASVAYNPGTADAKFSSGTTAVDIDATNLAATFTVPASGNIRIRLEAKFAIGFVGDTWWGVRSGSTVVAESFVGRGSQTSRCACTLYVTGLTPGASLTYKWSYRGDGGGTYTLTSGGTAGGLAGPSIMEIWSA